MADRTTSFEAWLHRLTMRSQLSSPDLDALRALPCEIVEVSSNRDVVRLGECTTHSCLVVSGLVGRFGQTDAGARQITAVHLPGDMVDLHSVVLPKASSALQALAASTIARFPHDALRAVQESSPRIARAFWRDCVVDGMMLAEWTLSVGRREAKARLAHLLCELSIRYGMIGHDPCRFPLIATQSHIADALGLTPVHVNRTLRKLQQMGIAQVEARTAVIRNWSGLAREGDFDPGYLHLPAAALEDVYDRIGIAS